MSEPDKPMVTVLMPVYNTERFLRYSIESVLNQTFTDFEFLIINDGSTDHSEEIIREYQDKRIVYIHKANEGVSRTLNYGIKLARGKYIRRHDSDDLSEPDMLALQMDFLKEHPDISFVSTQCAFMSPNGKIAYRYRQPKQSLFEDKPYVLASPDQFNPYSPIEHGSVLGPTRIFREMGGYRTEFLTSEDNDLWLRIIEKYKFAILNRCLYYHRMNEGSATVMHKPTLGFYRELAIRFAMERQETGSDPLMRGERMPEPEPVNEDPGDRIKAHKGKLFRSDLLLYRFKVMWNAKDWPEIFRILHWTIRDGWRVPATWRSILFTILGPRLVQWGVRVKSAFK
jgi:glycosyltransferase involved in cell wall biosynthesis